MTRAVACKALPDFSHLRAGNLVDTWFCSPCVVVLLDRCHQSIALRNCKRTLHCLLSLAQAAARCKTLFDCLNCHLSGLVHISKTRNAPDLRMRCSGAI
jgi:hypothetical protein